MNTVTQLAEEMKDTIQIALDSHLIRMGYLALEAAKLAKQAMT